MSRYIGNYVRVPSSEPQQASAPGIWSLSDQLAYQRANVWPPARDPYYNQTVLHLSGNIPNTSGPQAMNVPLAYNSDASTNNFLVTPNGDVSPRPFSPYMGSNYSAFFDGTGDYVSVSAGLPSGQGTAFTLECWVNLSNLNDYRTITRSAGGGTLDFGIQANGQVSLANTGVIAIATTQNGVVRAGVWTHIALTRTTGNLYTIYVNGLPCASGTNSTSMTANTTIGQHQSTASQSFSGYMTNFRVCNALVYTGQFTPSDAPLTATSQGATSCQLLCLQSNRFIDNSGNSRTITPSGDTRVTDNSPFVSADFTSGAGYFDGTTDWLSVGDQTAFEFGSGDYTVEFWWYPRSTADQNIVGKWDAGGSEWIIQWRSLGYYRWASNGNVISDSNTLTLAVNSWNHIAITKSGSSLRIYSNGSQINTTGTEGAITPTSAALTIGASQLNSSPGYVTGYITDVRILKGVVGYTGNFTPPINLLKTSGASSAASYSNISNVNISFAESATSLLTLQTRAASQNIGFIDSSPNEFIVTRSGNVSQGTFTPFSSSSYSFSTTATNTIDLPGSVLAFGSSSFTVEAWVYATHTSGAPIVYPYNSGNAVTSGGFSVSFGTGGVGYYAVNGATPINYSATIPLNTWYHLALVKDGTAARLYLNGQLVSTGTDSTTYTTPTGGARVGGIYNLSQTYGLVVNNLRIVTGQALYNANFTPATTNLTASVIGHQGLENTAITGTVRVLTARDPYRLDRSSNNHTISASGSPQVIPLSPFPSNTTQPLVTGGSAYFDGSSDFLSFAVNQAPLALGNSDFVCEAWVYRLSTATGTILGGQSDLNTAAGSAYVFYVSSSAGSDLYSGSSGYGVTSPNPGINQWAHVAWVRTGGTYSSYLNGVRVGTNSTLGTASVNVGATTYAPAVGGFTNGGSPLNGYISGLRLIKGSGIYDATQATINIPTAPPTSVPGTSLLLNFTGGGIVDATGKNNLETVGKVQIATAQAKWDFQRGGAALQFDGSGYLAYRNNPVNAFGTGDFTIELWVYHTSLSGQQTYFSDGFGASAGPYVYKDSSNLIGLYYSSQILTASSAIAANTWYHVAVVRQAGTVKLYIDGVQKASNPDTTNLTSPIQYVGNDGSSGAFSGYMTARVTNSARYTGSSTSTPNFTLPTGPFPIG